MAATDTQILFNVFKLFSANEIRDLFLIAPSSVRQFAAGKNLPVHIVGGLYTCNFETFEISFAFEFQNEYRTGFNCEPPIEPLFINDSLVIVIGGDENALPVSFSVK